MSSHSSTVILGTVKDIVATVFGNRRKKFPIKKNYLNQKQEVYYIMDILSSPHGISALSSLLQDCEKANSSSNGEIVPPVALNPTKVVARNTSKIEETSNSNSIWDDSEIPSIDAIVDPSDNRPCPRYEISYKQTVGTEDTFLGLSNLSPASFDCTDLVIKIHFPGSTMKDLDLDVTRDRIKAESKHFRLFTYFPVKVKHEKGCAKFDSKKEVLTVTVPIDDDEIS